MPWRGPEYPGEFPTLGFQVADLIEAKCAIPDGDHTGQPYLLTDEMLRFLLWHYRLDPAGRFAYRRSQLVRPQKWGKGPLSAAIVCAEADPEGPVLFDGWDAAGEPVGRPWATPVIQVTAVSIDQAENVWRSLVPMIELGGISADIPDTGETRINLEGGGQIKPVTSSARSRLGQRITFAVQDETHSWLRSNGGHSLADTQLRNLAGMGGRSIETTNAWDPADDSVAQRTHETAPKVGDIFVDMASSPLGSFGNKRERRRVLKAVYGDSWWVDLDRIDAEVEELLAKGEQPQAEQFFGNRVVTAADRAFDVAAWRELARPDLEVPTGRSELITLGFDGSRYDDATAVVATHVRLGHQWPLGVWEHDGTDGWEVPVEEVHDVVEAAFGAWDVWRLYADPPYWEDTIDGWAGRYGDKRVIRWWTNRTKVMCWALRGYVTAMRSAAVTHDGDAILERHIGNARKRVRPQIKDEKGKPMWDIAKDRPGSRNKIDAAMAAVLSWEARGDALAAGVLEKKGRRAWSC